MTRRCHGLEAGWTTGRYPFITVCTMIIIGLCLLASRFVANMSEATTSRNPFRKTPVRIKRAILLSSQDTGSTWLNSVLDGVDGVSFRGERLIGYSYKSYNEWLERDWKYYKWQLEKHLEVQEADGIQLVGFKLMYDQLPQQMHRPFAQWLNDNQIYVIHLRRRAAILQMASHNQKVQAMLSGSMAGDHVTNKSAVFEYPTIRFDPVRDPTRIRQLEQNQRDFADYLHVHAPLAPQMELWYEHLDGPHKKKWFNALFAFLGLDFKMKEDEAGSDFIKLGKRKCDDRIDGLQGPDYENLQGLESQMACAMLYRLSENETEDPTSKAFYPPENDKCQLTPAITLKCMDPSYNASAEPGKV